MKRVPVDPQPRGGFDLNALARLQDLLDQLALDLADDPIVEVVCAGAGGTDPQA